MRAWTSRMESGYAELLRRLERTSTERLSVVVTLRTTAGARRSAAQNYRIVAIQKKMYGRDPWFLDRAEQSRMRSLIETMLADVRAHPTRERVAALGKKVGEAIVTIYRAHIDMGRSQSGAMRSLSKSTRAAKIRKGTIGNPILIDTGELVGSIVASVEVV